MKHFLLDLAFVLACVTVAACGVCLINGANPLTVALQYPGLTALTVGPVSLLLAAALWLDRK
jgi:type IV secretory pathway VirB2 component (pilin)